MASAAEQLAANLNLSAFAKAEELRSASGSRSARCWSYRLGTIFLCPASIRPCGNRSSDPVGGILGMFNMFAGGGIHRMAIFALNIMRYIWPLLHHPVDDYCVAHP